MNKNQRKFVKYIKLDEKATNFLRRYNLIFSRKIHSVNEILIKLYQK